MKNRNDGSYKRNKPVIRRPIAPRGALPPDALPTGADGSPAAAVTAAPPHPQPQPQLHPQPSRHAAAHRAVLSADVRHNTRQCAPGDAARTPQKGQSAGLPAVAAAAAGAQWRLGHDASPLPARPAPDIRAVKRSPRSTRACDPRAPPRWHGCLQVSACKGKKKNPVC